MLTDIEIAKQADIKPISDIAEKLGISADELEFYGKYKAKLPLSLLKKYENKEDGKLILVTAINPTPAGEGKTTVTVGLGEAMNRIGKKAVIALREPSMGPVFGIKGRCCRRRLRSGNTDGGHKSSFHGRYARYNGRKQSFVRDNRQSYSAGKRASHRPEKDSLQALP